MQNFDSWKNLGARWTQAEQYRVYHSLGDLERNKIEVKCLIDQLAGDPLTAVRGSVRPHRTTSASEWVQMLFNPPEKQKREEPKPLPLF
jgi:hypothetical protein